MGKTIRRRDRKNDTTFQEDYKYHTDGGYGHNYPVPKAFKQNLKREYKRKQKMKLMKALKYDKLDDTSFDPDKKDAAYLYW